MSYWLLVAVLVCLIAAGVLGAIGHFAAKSFETHGRKRLGLD